MKGTARDNMDPANSAQSGDKDLSGPIRFGIFEVDLHTGELRKLGAKVKLQEQPFQVLAMLLKRPAEVVTREELQKKLWAADTFVDFERGLNRAINKLRESLGDDADRPRFIETVPRRGYRFLGQIEIEENRNPEALGGNRIAEVALVDPNQIEVSPSVRAAPMRRAVPWIAASVFAAVALLAIWRPRHPDPASMDRPFLQLEMDAGPDEFSQPAISADGLRIVLVSKGALVLRRLDQAKSTRIAGTEGANLPFFSPNGQWIAFFAAGKLQKIAVAGGVPVALFDALHTGGASWLDDNNIVLSLAEGLFLVPAAGGTPKLLVHSPNDPSNPRMEVWPQALPGGKSVLFSALDGSARVSLRVVTLGDGKVKTLVENATQGRYLAGGYLVYYKQGKLFAAPMDARRLELTGPAVPLVYGVSNLDGRADFDLSVLGTLVYRGGSSGANVISWLYSSGKIEPLIQEPGDYATPRLSPDGTRLALALSLEGKQNIWVYNIGPGNWNRLTFGSSPEFLPTWTPDGQYLAFRSGDTLAWTRSDGSGKVEHLTGVSPNAGPWSFSADEKWLAFWPLQPGSDLWIAPVERSSGKLRFGAPIPLLEQAESQGAPAISPDGRWFAYTSNESGRFQVYVRPFSPLRKSRSGKWPVSSNGGWSPVWSRDGKSLFYQNGGQVQVAVCAATGDSLLFARPRAWSDTLLGDTGLFYGFDPAPGGKRVLALLPAEDPVPQTFLRVLLNVDSELRRRFSERLQESR
jgi:serine/threonine-protein kinase